jgi:hypothetical protein
MKKAPKNKKTASKPKKNNKYEVIELPATNAEMEKYLDLHRKEINRRILNNIEHAVDTRMPTVEIFSFENSNFIVVMNKNDFRENLQNLLDFGMKTQDYEICTRAKKVMQKLDRLSVFFKYKKNKK